MFILSGFSHILYLEIHPCCNMINSFFLFLSSITAHECGLFVYVITSRMIWIIYEFCHHKNKTFIHIHIEVFFFPVCCFRRRDHYAVQAGFELLIFLLHLSQSVITNVCHMPRESPCPPHLSFGLDRYPTSGKACSLDVCTLTFLKTTTTSVWEFQFLRHSPAFSTASL